MSDSVKVRIGVQSARELELEVEDGEAVIAQLEGARDGIAWIVDVKGHRHGVVIDKLVFVEVESGRSRPGVGFGT